MRCGNLDGRLVLIGRRGLALDVEEHSNGRFGPDPQTAYESWSEFNAWAATVEVDRLAQSPVCEERLGPPVPRPRQVFAIGLNYRDHAVETGFVAPTEPLVFTKFQSSLTGPTGAIELPKGGTTDWEVELVVVMGGVAKGVDPRQAWDLVAGVTVGQDISERASQMSGSPPQFSLAKSFPGFAPTGPFVVTVDELPDREDLELGCSINGEEMQKGMTRDLVFPIPELIARLSRVVTLFPGDLLFTGTPSGVGMGREPQRWLEPGDVLVSYVKDVGEMRHTFVEQGA